MKVLVDTNVLLSAALRDRLRQALCSRARGVLVPLRRARWEDEQPASDAASAARRPDTLAQLPQRRGKISSADEIFKIGDDVSRDVMAIGREGEEYFVFRGV